MSPEAHRARSEKTKNRVLPPKTCETCPKVYVPKAGNQLRCQACKEGNRDTRRANP